MKKKNLWMICAAAAVMAAGSTVYAADFSDGEAPVISAEEPQLMDSAEIFDDGNLEEQELVFGDTVSETELLQRQFLHHSDSNRICLPV